MKNAKLVSTEELATVLMNMTNGIGGIANVIQVTQPKVTKKDRDTKEPFNGQITKISKLNILVATKYEKGILNQLNKENKSSEEYKKGTNTMPLNFENSSNEFVGTFKNEAVIQYRPMENSNPSTKYFLNGLIKDKGMLPNVLPKPSKATNQGTEKEIFWRKLYIKNLKQITIDKVTYINSDLI
jgi:hypothetical protein